MSESGSDDDIDMELLQAVGHGPGKRKGGTSGKKRRRETGRADGESSSGGEDDDVRGGEASEFAPSGSYRGAAAERHGRNGYGSKGADADVASSKSKSSVMPFKKRFDTSADAVAGGPDADAILDRSRQPGDVLDDADEGSFEEASAVSGRGDDSGSELSYGPDLYKDEEDKARLDALPEVEREGILLERGERLEQRKVRQELRRKRRERKARERGAAEVTPARPKHSARGPSPPPLSWKRSTPAQRHKESALQKLEEAKVKRHQKQHGTPLSQKEGGEGEEEDKEPKDSAAGEADSSRRRIDLGRGARGEDDEELGLRGSLREEDDDEDEEDEEEEKEGEEEEDEDDDDYWERREKQRARDEAEDGREDGEEMKEELATWEDIKQLVITRRVLSEWFWEPHFESTVSGCYVRLLLPPPRNVDSGAEEKRVYRVCQVVGVDARTLAKPYDLEGRKVSKLLDLRWGSHRRSWEMSLISNAPPTEEEIVQLLRQIERGGTLKRPLKSDVRAKQSEIEAVRSMRYDSQSVRAIVEAKRKASGRVTNLAFEKDRLEMALLAADREKGLEEVERLQGELLRLQELEEQQLQTLKQGVGHKVQLVADMNKRNRQENFKASSAGPKKGGVADALLGADDLDPFSRRWTRSQNYYKTPVHKAPEAEGSKESMVGVSEAGKASTRIGQGTVDGTPTKAGLTSSQAVTSAVLSMDFSVLDRLGGAAGWPNAFMAWKQRQERLYGAPTACQDGRTHAQVLSLADYKRRRGLL